MAKKKKSAAAVASCSGATGGAGETSALGDGAVTVFEGFDTPCSPARDQRVALVADFLSADEISLLEKVGWRSTL